MRPPWVVTTNPECGARRALHIEREHEHLRAEAVGDLVDQVGPRDRGRVHADLVGADAEEPRDVVGRAHPSPDGERDEDLFGGAPHDVVGRRALVDGGGDVEERELVGALREVLAGEFDGVAHVAEVLEVDALHDAPSGDVEARDHAAHEGHRYSLALWIAVTRIARAPIA